MLEHSSSKFAWVLAGSLVAQTQTQPAEALKRHTTWTDKAWDIWHNIRRLVLFSSSLQLPVPIGTDQLPPPPHAQGLTNVHGLTITPPDPNRLPSKATWASWNCSNLIQATAKRYCSLGLKFFPRSCHLTCSYSPARSKASAHSSSATAAGEFVPKASREAALSIRSAKNTDWLQRWCWTEYMMALRQGSITGGGFGPHCPSPGPSRNGSRTP